MPVTSPHVVQFPDRNVVLDSRAGGERPFETAAARRPELDSALQELGIFIGSAAMWNVVEQASIVARSELPVLLLGETGTGKERFCRLIHKLSARRHKEVVAINCAAIPREIAESYLFGYVKGAFTGASSDRRGVFEEASGSTLLLDEIGELPLDLQAKLLRVIEDGAVQRVGSASLHEVDVRIIAATNRNLYQEVLSGRFREDLYFRLAVVEIELPPLRERRTEIEALSLTLLAKINQKRHAPRQLSNAAIRRLEEYVWPGNVRQLANVLERAVLYALGEVVAADDLLILDVDATRDEDQGLPEPRTDFRWRITWRRSENSSSIGPFRSQMAINRRQPGYWEFPSRQSASSFADGSSVPVDEMATRVVVATR